MVDDFTSVDPKEVTFSGDLSDESLYGVCGETGEVELISYHYCPLCGDCGWLPGLYCRSVRDALKNGTPMTYDPVTGEKLNG